jgi:hypothetical protein
MLALYLSLDPNQIETGLGATRSAAGLNNALYVSDENSVRDQEEVALSRALKSAQAYGQCLRPFSVRSETRTHRSLQIG